MATKHTIAQAKYDKANRRVYGFRLHNEIDNDIISKLAEVESMQGYIKGLIREDLARTGSAPKLSVSVPLCDSAMEYLQEESARTGKDIETLAKLIIETYLIQNSIMLH